MQWIQSVLAFGALALSLTGCRLVEALLPDGTGLMPMAGTCATYQVVAADDQGIDPEILEQTRTIIEHRVDDAGVAEPVIVTLGDDRISVELPGVEDEADMRSLRSLITVPGVLAFLPVPPELQGTVTEGPLPEGMAAVEPIFSGDEIASVAIDLDSPAGEPVVDLRLNPTGAGLFDEFAADHLGQQFAIVFDGEVLSAPTIYTTRFGGEAQISGPYTTAEATHLVTVMKYGSLPLEIREISFGACEGAR